MTGPIGWLKAAAVRRDERFLTSETKNARRFSGDDAGRLKALLSKVFARKRRPAEPAPPPDDGFQRDLDEAMSRINERRIVTADEVAEGTISGAMIVAGSITSDKIASGSITTPARNDHEHTL